MSVAFEEPVWREGRQHEVVVVRNQDQVLEAVADDELLQPSLLSKARHFEKVKLIYRLSAGARNYMGTREERFVPCALS